MSAAKLLLHADHKGTYSTPGITFGRRNFLKMKSVHEMEFHYKYSLIFYLTYDLILQKSDLNIVTFC